VISHTHKFIFIHIPRTGGTSIEKLLDNSIERGKHESLFSLEKKVDISSFFKFSFIRNPWDITISKYVAPYYRKINKLSNKSFLYFLENYFPAPNEEGDSFHDYFDPSKLDFIGRFETREADLVYISDKIGIELDPNFSVKAKEMQKTRSKKHYTEYYNEETKQIVAEKYAKDIEYFGYEFGK
jgi:chondroitin 4-sulfotransferase 11